MLTAMFILIGAAFICAVLALASPPKWPQALAVSVLLLCIVVLLKVIPKE